MRIGDIISLVRTTVKANSDDSKYSDQYFYTLIKSARSRLLSKKSINEQLSPWNWQTICVPLEKVKYHNCDCIDIGCDVLKSKIAIPQVVLGNNGNTKSLRPFIVVETFNGMSLPYVSPQNQITNRSTEILQDVPAYYIQDNKLIIWNTLDIRAVMVRGVFSDPMELVKINICNEDGVEYDKCTYDVLYEPFPIDEQYVNLILDDVFNRLRIPLSTQTDNVNEGITS